MNRRRRSGIVGGLVLVSVGAWLLAIQLAPDLGAWASENWPLSIVAVGVLLLLIGLIVRSPGMAVPASIVSGIGGLMYWQDATGNWGSWGYAWTLIPGFVGVGIVLAGLLGGTLRRSLREGSGLIILSLVMFTIFGGFLGGQAWERYWPALLIAAGLWLLVRPLLRGRST